MSAKRTLVTGGAGFLGAHLCRRLWREGDEVICLDNLLTGSFENIEDLLGQPRFTFVEHDVVDPYDFEVERIYNMACAASPAHYQRHPVHTTLTNVLGVRNALELAARRGARVLQASTSEIYGDPEVHPQREDYVGHVNTLGPRACYDEGKRCAESLVMDFHRLADVDARIARIFNTYGPAMSSEDGRLVTNFITQALRGEALTVYGDGMQTRSLCYVDDLIEGLVGLMERAGRVEPVNLGNPEERTVLEVAEAVLRLAGEGEIVFKPLPRDDPRRRRPDIGVARRLFGFAPRVGFEAGLRKTWAWFEPRTPRRRPDEDERGGADRAAEWEARL